MSWDNITIDVKRKVVGLLDYESRCNLRICSKDDRDTVDSTKFIANTLKFVEIPSEMSGGKSIIRVEMDTLTIWFIGKENITRIDRGWKNEISQELSETKQENRYDLLRRFLEKYTYKGAIRAVSVEIDSLDLTPSETWTLKCDNLKMFQLPGNHDLEWLRATVSLGRKFKNVEICKWADETEAAELICQLKPTESMRLSAHETEITDEQIEQIEATDLRFSSRRITINGIKNAMERFLKNGKKTDVFELHNMVFPENFNVLQVIPKSVIVRKLKKENEQEGEFYGKILGGFENVNGVQDPRELDCAIYGNMFAITCKVYEKSTRPCIMYPFTNNWLH